MLDDLLSDVSTGATIGESALALIVGIVQRFAEVGTDAEKLVALGNELLAQKAALAEAVEVKGSGHVVAAPVDAPVEVAV